MNHTVLVVHDDPAALARIASRLERGGHDVRRARSAAEARQTVLEDEPGVILSPVRLADMPAERAPEHFRRLHKDVGIVLLAQGVEIDEASSMLDRCADDFILCPMEESRLVSAVDHVLERRELQERLEQMQSGHPQQPAGPALTRPGEIRTFAQYERDILLHALYSTGWNVKETATRLRIGRATLYRKIERYDLRAQRGRRAS